MMLSLLEQWTAKLALERVEAQWHTQGTLQNLCNDIIARVYPKINMFGRCSQHKLVVWTTGLKPQAGIRVAWVRISRLQWLCWSANLWSKHQSIPKINSLKNYNVWQQPSKGGAVAERKQQQEQIYMLHDLPQVAHSSTHAFKNARSYACQL